jgi:predicted MFS family arabinose efflux permease
MDSAKQTGAGPVIGAPPANRPATRLATRLLFLAAGFGYACWAPLVPLSKQRLGIDDQLLGLLFLCIGAGSIAAMVATGILTARLGNRPILIGSGFGFAAVVAILPVADTSVTLGLTLLAFGATLGALDVAMNVHAVEVESAAGTPLMSGFHALFSIGGFAGAAFMTFLLSRQVAVQTGTLLCAALIMAAMLLAAPRLLAGAGAHDGPAFAIPRGLVLVIALLAGITFLVEGALLDWSALLMTDAGLVPLAQGGLGYMFFSVAMTAGRLTGDAVAARFGDRRTLLWGGAVAICGFVVLLAAAGAAMALAGFVLIGLGCSNIVPVLFRRAAAQASMPSALAVAAVTTTAYAGMLAGPAAIGFVAKAASLHLAFWLLAGLLLLVPLCATAVSAERK